MKFALVGNQNSGKTTLFNQLTGSNQRVGNFPGVTVDRKEGELRGHKDMVVVDLPGIYSLSPYSSEEIVSRDFIINEKPDAIINIVDASNIERNLYLTMQLIELRVPMVIALNMMDEVRANGGSIKIKEMEEELGVNVVPISASKNEGISELINRLIETSKNKVKPKRIDFCEGAVHRAIHSVSHIIEDHADSINIPRRYAGTRLIEGDKLIEENLKLDPNEKDLIKHIITQLESESNLDRRAAMADMRYHFIENLVKKTVIKPKKNKDRERSSKIDEILTHKYFGIPIFFAIMLFIFWITFSVIGTPLSDLLGDLINNFGEFIGEILSNFGLNHVILSLITDGVIAGVGSVLSFLPIIITLFFLLSILEDTGYMARVAFMMDKLLRKIGLSGRSLVPLIIGFGCTVPAVMATRTLSSERDRKLTILLTPFMSCSAKLPIYGVFTVAFFENYRALIMFSLYLLGIIVAILLALILKNFKEFKGNPVPFVMELPNYRFPSPKSVVILLWEKAKDFIERAFTVIFVSSVIIWVLINFDIQFNHVVDPKNSMLAGLSSFIAPIFAPLGFGNWESTSSLIVGMTAKETVISTFAVILEATVSDLPSLLRNFFTPQSAYAFLVFSLLYTPCFATVATIHAEYKSAKKTILISLSEIGIAWIVSFIIYRILLLIS